jgi:hypothetical protein
MSSGRLTYATIRALDWLAGKTLPGSTGPAHQRIGHRGEEEAYFFLRKLGYVMVAQQFPLVTPAWRKRFNRVGQGCSMLC